MTALKTKPDKETILFLAIIYRNHFFVTETSDAASSTPPDGTASVPRVRNNEPGTHSKHSWSIYAEDPQKCSK